MFSKKMALIAGLILLIAVNIIALFMIDRSSSLGISRFSMYIIAPFQSATTKSFRSVKNLWYQYFYFVSAAEECKKLKKQLACAVEKNNRLRELELSNLRLRKILKFRKTLNNRIVAAEVIGRDPAFWFKTIMIDKGSTDGLEKWLPVVVPEGIVGQIIEVSLNSSKVLLIIDQNSAVDVLVQKIRARGIIKGESHGRCRLKYVLRKYDVNVDDIVISTGLDGVFPKGLRVGRVASISRQSYGIFQEVTVIPYVDFERLEEILVMLKPSEQDHSDNDVIK